ncbi:hypothetical protein OTU49_002597, partial [Cherax quadricarinatus]
QHSSLTTTTTATEGNIRDDVEVAESGDSLKGQGGDQAVYASTGQGPEMERKKKSGNSANKENRMCSRDSSMSAFQMGGDDSNTAMSMMSDSQDATDFSSTQFNISEDSNSEPPFKKKLMEGRGDSI